MKETGKVTGKQGNLAQVELKQNSACAKCGVCAFGKSGTLMLEAVDNAGASVGDHVEIEIPEANVIWSSILVFILPLVAFFTGFLVKGIVLALAALLIYIIFLYFYDRRAKIAPKVTRIL